MDDWILFGSQCYGFGQSFLGPLTWREAEGRCQEWAAGGHLVSIMSWKEMTFLHYMLTTQWITNSTRSFIGGLPTLLQTALNSGKCYIWLIIMHHTMISSYIFCTHNRTQSAWYTRMALEWWLSHGLHWLGSELRTEFQPVYWAQWSWHWRMQHDWAHQSLLHTHMERYPLCLWSSFPIFVFRGHQSERCIITFCMVLVWCQILLFFPEFFVFSGNRSKPLYSEMIKNETQQQEVSGLFHCDSGEFILSQEVCDSHEDCFDSSDEFSCHVGKQILPFRNLLYEALEFTCIINAF